MSQREKVIKARHNTATKLNKRLRKETRLTPWRDSWELESVGRGLLSVLQLPSTTIERALDTVNVWKARSHALEAIPHAVESTAALAHVYWRDHVEGGASVTELRLAYSAAVIRCINGFADALQQQRFLAAPVSILCGHLGIPTWLVDIRHEASHNALPSLPVLRLATTTLLEYLQKEYWMPTCSNWGGDQADDIACETSQGGTMPVKPIDILMQYKACASRPPPDAPEEDEKTPPINETRITKKSPKASINEPVTTKPFDTFFGDKDDESSDDEDDWEDSVLGGLWGSSFGSNVNRFAALEPPKKPKAQPKKKKLKKPKKPPQRKKVLGEKYPTDYAKEFVEAVSPQEGYSLAIQFLVWGGVGGAPVGRGVLIPGSLAAFPATPQGIRKSWDRYVPLLEVLGRVWPGFLVALLIHLVDFVLSIETQCANQGSQDASSARKLYFLYAWIRCLVSQDFVQKLYPEEKDKGNKGNTTESPLATLEQLDPLHYPLNSLCDRCSGRDKSEDFTKTSRDVLQLFQDILNSHRVEGQGVGLSGPTERLSLEPIKEEPDTARDETAEFRIQGPVLSDGKMSLDDMEALLSIAEVDTGRASQKLETPEKNAELSIEPTNRPVAWTRCISWDACAIGSMPGQPV